MLYAYATVIIVLIPAVLPAAHPTSELERIAVAFCNKSSHMPSDIAAAYRSIFATHDDQVVEGLLRHESLSVALKASWRLAELKCTQHPNQMPLVRFIGFVEGCTKARSPHWWEASALAARFHDDDRRRLRPVGWPDVDADLFPIHRVQLADQTLTVPPDTELKYEADWLLWTSGDLTTRIPRSFIQAEKLRGHNDWATVLTHGEQTYVAVGTDLGGSFGLVCLAPGGKERWQSSGWGNGALRGGASGVWWSACEMAIAADAIVVFGKAYPSLFIEAFSLQSGEPLYRFSTRYIEEEID